MCAKHVKRILTYILKTISSLRISLDREEGFRTGRDWDVTRCAHYSPQLIRSFEKEQTTSSLPFLCLFTHSGSFT